MEGYLFDSDSELFQCKEDERDTMENTDQHTDKCSPTQSAGSDLHLGLSDEEYFKMKDLDLQKQANILLQEENIDEQYDQETIFNNPEEIPEQKLSEQKENQVQNHFQNLQSKGKMGPKTHKITKYAKHSPLEIREGDEAQNPHVYEIYKKIGTKLTNQPRHLFKLMNKHFRDKYFEITNKPLPQQIQDVISNIKKKSKKLKQENYCSQKGIKSIFKGTKHTSEKTKFHLRQALNILLQSQSKNDLFLIELPQKEAYQAPKPIKQASRLVRNGERNVRVIQQNYISESFPKNSRIKVHESSSNRQKSVSVTK